MTAFAALTALGAASWLLRISFITGICPARLPTGLQRALEYVGPAVLAALIVTTLVHRSGIGGLFVPSPHLLALVIAGVVSWRWHNLLAPIGAALGSFWLLSLVLPASS